MLGFLLASDHLSVGLSCWKATCFTTHPQVGVWGMVLVNHRALWVVIGLWKQCAFLKQAAEAQILFSIHEGRKVTHGSSVDESCRRMDSNSALRLLLTLPTDGKIFRWLSARKEAFWNHTPVWRLRLRLLHFKHFEDLILKSDADQTWGKFRQASLVLLSQQHHDSVVEVYVPARKNKLALSK